MINDFILRSIQKIILNRQNKHCMHDQRIYASDRRDSTPIIEEGFYIEGKVKVVVDFWGKMAAS